MQNTTLYKDHVQTQLQLFAQGMLPLLVNVLQFLKQYVTYQIIQTTYQHAVSLEFLKALYDFAWFHAKRITSTHQWNACQMIPFLKEKRYINCFYVNYINQEKKKYMLTSIICRHIDILIMKEITLIIKFQVSFLDELEMFNHLCGLQIYFLKLFKNNLQIIRNPSTKSSLRMSYKNAVLHEGALRINSVETLLIYIYFTNSFSFAFCVTQQI